MLACMENHPPLDSAPLPALYRKTILSFPLIVVTLLILALCFFAWQARHFSLDASADALLLENDKDLQIYRASLQRYGTGDFLVVTYDPEGDLFNGDSLKQLASLRDELARVDSVDSVFSILDVPLLTSSGASLTELTAGVPTLSTHPDSDLELVRQEITNSPVFSELIVSKDASTTALQLNLKSDDTYSNLHAQRSALRLKQLQGELGSEEESELAAVNAEFDTVRREFNKKRHDDITAIRSILEQHRDKAAMHLGGVPMVSDDMVSYIARDLVVFLSLIHI